ncbi:aldehyde dehydrogenase (NAD+) [Cyclobacterium xiamenense]|uniref:Aldehyde dehydrogenase n=1 Tax=Cyclobacterium xiamenense TaxID=1297121 RepID=A0A1H6UJF9_9BACT|nr:aldehyde dehydrogenase family protein [Cyclobacterium xiamenense]SEI90824.1 aldehyde dehydrogenase (NAD+) [Cyclobacterium xiamenense]
METQTLSKVDLAAVFQSQQRKALQLKKSAAQERIARLLTFKEAVIANMDNVYEALYKDYKKPKEEASETDSVIVEIDFVVGLLEKWMKPQVVPTPEGLGGAASVSKIIVEPKGVCLFLTPWNYPILLTLRPLVACLAAGNTVIIKPSELTPHSSKLIKEIIESVFPKEEVFVMEGGADVASELLELPFNHIFYTGGTRVGKIVMKAAANYMASVTMELGGKCPSIIDDSADFADAAGKIVWTKFYNCGQTCITTDYILVSENCKDEFIAHLKGTIEHLYGVGGPGIESSNYGRLVNNNHYQRVKKLLDDALEHGATLVIGGKTNEGENYISPTLLDNVDPDLAIMKEEIFGPLLPVLSYKTLDDAIDFVNQRERPLGLYVYSKDKGAADRVINSTTAEGSVINHTSVHYMSPHLPFGGVGTSGIGRGNGYFGFMDFSNQRPVLEMP